MSTSEDLFKSCCGKNEEHKQKKYQYPDVDSKHINSRLILNYIGCDARTYRSFDERTPLFLTDIQDFLLLSILDPEKFYYIQCKWIDIVDRQSISSSLILIVDGMTMCDYFNSHKTFVNLNNGFNDSCLEILSHGKESDSVIETMSIIPLVQVEKDDLVRVNGCMEVSLEQLNNPNTMLRYVFPILNTRSDNKSTNELNDFKLHEYTRMTLLLPPSKMLSEKYPLPMPGRLKSRYSNYIYSKELYFPVTASSPMFGLDCERCDTDGGSELFRVSIVDEANFVVYNSYVLPQYPIRGRRQMFSGITRDELLNVTTKLEDVQMQIQKILPPDAILIGQSLNYDMHALHMMHPYVINTSCVYNSSGSRRWKSKLRDFTLEYLDRYIQQRGKGHCSIEDAEAALDLVKLKLKNTPQFGDVILKNQQTKHKSDNEDNVKNVKKKKNYYEKPVLLSSKLIIEKYIENMTRKSCRKVNCLEEMDLISCAKNTDILSYVANFIKKRKLILSHIDVTETENDSHKKLDKIIGNIWGMSPGNTLITILLTGNKQCNGALFYNIKMD